MSPLDGFVLSRVDGNLTEADLAAVTGLPQGRVEASLAKLAGLGLITFDATAPASAPRKPTPPPQPAPGRHATPAAHPVAPRPPLAQPSPPAKPAIPAAPAVAAAPALSSSEQACLAEENDLEVDHRKRILEAYRTLEERDHYALLGVAESADRKVIKRAYYELAAAFHPDRYFRKRLGSFKVRMEAVFARLTIAHDTLSDKEKRKEYDAYLSEQRISQAIEEHLAHGLAQAREAEESIAASVRAEEQAHGPAAAPPPPAPVVAVAAESPQVDVALRRQALARRLLGGARPPSSPSVGAPDRATGTGPQAPMSTADAVAALKRRYEDRLQRARAGESRKFASQGDAALAAGDLVAAANMFRIAANLAPADADLQRRAAESRGKADLLLRETYMRQARYEEDHGQWAEAARSWTRVCKVSPDDHSAHDRAANAICKAQGDMHHAVKLAARACELEPGNALYRVTLANCYSAAGLALNAKRELDTAAQLAPHDDTIQSMIKRVGQPA